MGGPSTAHAAIFDLDGTLVDLPVDIAEVRRRVAALFETRGWRGELRPILSAIDRAAAAIETGPLARARLARCARAAIDAAEIRAARVCELRAGAADALRRLHGEGTALAVVTNNCRPAAERALERLGIRRLVSAVIGRDAVERPKPDPAGLLRALARLGEPRSATWVGDSAGDIEAGRRLAELRPELDLEIVGIGGVAGGDRSIGGLAEL